MSGGRAEVPGASAAAFGPPNAHGRATSQELQIRPRRGVRSPPALNRRVSSSCYYLLLSSLELSDTQSL